MSEQDNFRIQISPSDASSYVSFHRRAWYDNNPPEVLEPVENEFAEIIKERGI